MSDEERLRLLLRGQERGPEGSRAASDSTPAAPPRRDHSSDSSNATGMDTIT